MDLGRLAEIIFLRGTMSTHTENFDLQQPLRGYSERYLQGCMRTLENHVTGDVAQSLQATELVSGEYFTGMRHVSVPLCQPSIATVSSCLRTAPKRRFHWTSRRLCLWMLNEIAYSPAAVVTTLGEIPSEQQRSENLS